MAPEAVLFDEELDASGQRCPLPVLKTRKRMKKMAPGSILRLLADDPVAPLDVANYCREDGHELVGKAAAGDGWYFFIRKDGAGGLAP